MSYKMNRRKFLTYVGCGCCGFVINSCTTAPITDRKQLKLIPEAKLNAQAAQIYEKVKEKEKLIKDTKSINEIKEIGKKMEDAISIYFDKSDLPDPTVNFNWEYKDRFKPMRMDGKKAVKVLYDLGLQPDFIYLDMDHEYETVYEDLHLILKYFPNVTIVGDDYMFHVGVCKALHQIMDVYHHNINHVVTYGNCYAIAREQISNKNFVNFNRFITNTDKPSATPKHALLFAITKDLCDEPYLKYIHSRYGDKNIDIHVIVVSDHKKYGLIFN